MRNQNPCLEEVESEFIDAVCSYFGREYDEEVDGRPGRRTDSAFPSIRQTAEEFHISPQKVKRILITGGLFSSSTTKQIGEMYSTGMGVHQIAELLNMSRSAVLSYLPYKKIVYNLPERSAGADRIKRYYERKKGIDSLLDCIQGKDGRLVSGVWERDVVWKEALWNCIVLFQNQTFMTAGRGKNQMGSVEFSYTLKVSSRTGEPTDEMVISTREGKTVTRSSVELAMSQALKLMEAEGCVSGPKKLGGFGSSYLYGIFLRWGVIVRG